MIKKLCALFVLFASFPVLAENMSDLVTEDSPYLVNLGEEVEVKDNSPILYIEGVDAPERANNIDEELYIRLFGTKDIAKATRSNLALDPGFSLDVPENQEDNFTIRTPFGQTIKAGLIDHISDFIATAQVLNQNTISISEELSQMNTKSDAYFVRHITIPDNNQFQLIDSVQNGQSIPFDVISLSENELTLRSPIPLDIGPNKIVLKYILNGSIVQQDGSANILIHLTNDKLNFPIDRMQAIVLFPDTTKIIEKTMLFGSNEQEIPDAVQIVEDFKGNVVYRLTHLIPEKAGMKIKVVLDPVSIPKDSLWNRFMNSNHGLWVTLMCLGIVFYLICATYWELRKKPLNHLPIKIRLPFDLELPIIYGSRVTSQFLNNIMKYKENIFLKIVSKLSDNLFGRMIVNSCIQLLVFIRIMGEMCLGVVLLILITALMTSVYSDALPLSTIMWTMAVSLIALIIIYKLLLKPNYKKSLMNFVKLAMSQENLISLSSKQIQALYPLMVTANQYNDWHVLLHKQNPNVQVLDKGV